MLRPSARRAICPASAIPDSSETHRSSLITHRSSLSLALASAIARDKPGTDKSR